jgi:phosphatidylserine/phosphatidylglycerophosphate/cardiolipin synthase-like enzyme
MSLLGSLLVRSEEIVGLRSARIPHRSHRGMLEAAALEAGRERELRHAWWGDEPRWFAGGTPPREHNHLTPLIDGEEYFTDLYATIANATRYVYIAGWCLTAHVPILRSSMNDLTSTRLIEVLRAAAQRVPVRILLWGGAMAIIRPTRGDVDELIDSMQKEVHGDLVAVADHTAHMTHCHHQKSVVVDGQKAYVGVIDMTTFSGERWDRNAHPLRAGVNWHDAAVAIEGQAVADVEANFRQRWQAVTGKDDLPHADPEVRAGWDTPVQIVRTIPKKTYDFAPKGEFGIHHAYIESIRRAQRLIYLESQYLWSPEIMDALFDALNSPPPMFPRIVVVLPARATSGKWDNDQHVKLLREADAGRRAIEAYTLYTSGTTAGMHPFRYRPTYVHAKLAVFDDEWLLLGSANLNNRGMVTDSELNVLAHDQALATQLRVKLWSEHLGLSEEDVAGADPIELVDVAWRRLALTNKDIVERGDRPLRSPVLRYEPGKMPGDWLLEEIEELTFEH